ncbi:MAG: hypothetical protein JJ863_35765 [Deltaproteobacteria bacterium]|nr:hypothetical protein [Deltaproteobacteria bacterium]
MRATSTWALATGWMVACAGSVAEPPAAPASAPPPASEIEPEPTAPPVAEEVPEDGHAAFVARVEGVAPELVERALDVDPAWGSYEAREADGHLIVSFSEWGNGIDGAWSEDAHVFREGEPVARVRAGALDGQYVWAVRVEPSLSAEGVSEAVAAWAEGPVVDDGGDPHAGWADLFLGAVTDPPSVAAGAFTLHGPLYRPDRATPSAETSADECEGAERRPWFSVGRHLPPAFRRHPTIDEHTALFRWDEYEAPQDGLEVVGIGVRGACIREHQWGSVRLRRHALAGRNGGEAVLLVDGEGPPRWVLETRQAVLGTRVEWLAPASGWLIGRYQSLHGGYLYARAGGLVAVRVADGAAFRVDVARAYERGTIEGEVSYVARGEAGMDQCLEEQLGRRDGPLEDHTVPSPEEFARCEALLSPGVEVSDVRLRVRRPDGQWVALPLARLSRMAHRLSPPP